ncbi:MAG: hypothetical protein AAFX57_14765 [Bacteroidota bacterium]
MPLSLANSDKTNESADANKVSRMHGVSEEKNPSRCSGVGEICAEVCEVAVGASAPALVVLRLIFPALSSRFSPL